MNFSTRSIFETDPQFLYLDNEGRKIQTDYSSGPTSSSEENEGLLLAEIKYKLSFKAAFLSILYTAFRFAAESPYDLSTVRY